MNSFLTMLFVFSLSLLFANSVQAEERRYVFDVKAVNPDCNNRIVIVDEKNQYFRLEVYGCSLNFNQVKKIETNFEILNFPGTSARIYNQSGTVGCHVGSIQNYRQSHDHDPEICNDP